MARSVEITTPMPTLDEVGDRLGLSQKRRAKIISLFRKDGHSGGTLKSHHPGERSSSTQTKASSSGKAAAKK